MTKEISLTQGKSTLVSDDDYERIHHLKWTYNPHRAGYAMTRIDGKTVYMHRLILSAPKGLEVDHIDGDSLNNQRNNLRLATRRENARNSRRHRTSNPLTNFKGVCRASGTKWIAQLRVNDRTIKIGPFETDREAAIAYDNAARLHFGEFARTNFVKEEREDTQDIAA